MKRILTILALLGLCIRPGLSQVQTVHNEIPNPEVFGLELGAQQSFYGRVRAVNSVSIHSYLTATFRVTEMVIDFSGSSLQLRIYSTEPATPLNQAGSTAQAATSGTPVLPTAIMGAQSLANRASSPATVRLQAASQTLPVVKDYPTTTHAKTIEFKLNDATTVEALFQTVSSHWLGRAEAVDAARSADAETKQTGRISPLSRAVFRLGTNR